MEVMLIVPIVVGIYFIGLKVIDIYNQKAINTWSDLQHTKFSGKLALEMISLDEWVIEARKYIKPFKIYRDVTDDKLRRYGEYIKDDIYKNRMSSDLKHDTDMRRRWR